MRLKDRIFKPAQLAAEGKSMLAGRGVRTAPGRADSLFASGPQVARQPIPAGGEVTLSYSGAEQYDNQRLMVQASTGPAPPRTRRSPSHPATLVPHNAERCGNGPRPGRIIFKLSRCWCANAAAAPRTLLPDAALAFPGFPPSSTGSSCRAETGRTGSQSPSKTTSWRVPPRNQYSFSLSARRTLSDRERESFPCSPASNSVPDDARLYPLRRGLTPQGRLGAGSCSRGCSGRWATRPGWRERAALVRHHHLDERLPTTLLPVCDFF